MATVKPQSILLQPLLTAGESLAAGESNDQQSGAESETQESVLSAVHGAQIEQSSTLNNAPSGSLPPDEGSPPGPVTASGANLSNTSVPPAVSPTEWMSSWLRKWTLLGMFLTTVILMGAIISVFVRSATHKGIATVHWTQSTGREILPELRLSIGLMWTVFPAFIFQVYALMVAAIVKAAAARQPYIELRRAHPLGRGAAAEKSIFLDYEALLPPKAPFRALRHNHYMLAYGLTVAMIISIGLTALASHLLTTAQVAFEKSIEIKPDFAFNDLGLTARSDLGSVIDSVASTQIHGGKTLPWTTADAAFLKSSLGGVPDTPRLELNTTAYSAIPDCRILRQAQEFALGPKDGGWYLNLLDRGCATSNQFLTGSILPAVKQYIQLYTNTSCGAEAGESRFAVVFAFNTDESDTSFSSATAVSCRPVYQLAEGILSISIDDSRQGDPGFISFLQDDKTASTDRSTFAATFEHQIGQPGTFDNTNTLQGPAVGRLMYQYAQALSSASPPKDATLATAVDAIFRASFAAMASTYLVQRTTPSAPARRAIYSVPTTRLLIFPPVAYTIIFILVLALIMLGWTYLYTHSSAHASILYEEPIGIAGVAAVLRYSEVVDVAEGVDADACRGQVAGGLRNAATAKGWTLDDWERPGSARIVSTTGVADWGWSRIFRR